MGKNSNKKQQKNKKKGEELIDSGSSDNDMGSNRPGPSTTSTTTASKQGGAGVSNSDDDVSQRKSDYAQHSKGGGGPSHEDLARLAASREQLVAQKAEKERERKQKKAELAKQKDEMRRGQKQQHLKNYLNDSINKAPQTLKQQLANMSFGIGVVIFLFAIFALRLGEEGWSSSGRGRNSDDGETFDFYKALEVERNATPLDIKKSFRKLSLRWHPDKNPNCEACAVKFRQLSKAYDVLGDPDKRKGYDLHDGVIDDALKSNTLSITAENFDQHLGEGMEGVWLVQVYDDHDEWCRSFSPVWEETASQLNKYLHFGRIHVKKDKAAVKRLPLRAGVLPTIFMMGPDHQPHLFSNVYNPNVASLRKFVLENYPSSNVATLTNSKDLSRYLSKGRGGRGDNVLPSIVIVANRKNPTLSMRAAAGMWGPVFSFAHITPDVFMDADCLDAQGTQTTCESSLKMSKDHDYIVAFPDPSTVNSMKTGSEVMPYPLGTVNMTKKQTLKGLYPALYQLQEHVVPYIHEQNVDLLCRSNDIHRVYCLVLVNATESDEAWSVKTVSAAIEKSKKQYTEEELSTKQDGDDTGDEPTELQHIQVVRLSTLSSGPYSVAKVPPFQHLWKQQMNSTKAFLLDLDGNRFAALSDAQGTGFVSSLYQNLLDELLNFEALPDECDASVFASNCLKTQKKGFFGRLGRSLCRTLFSSTMMATLAIGAVALATFYGDPRQLFIQAKRMVGMGGSS